ncbi:cysteine proteinase [Polyplosphaeria fusca]|uniref:Cysteine proteinase n=1 Tax=Polyplosphaeria fusca TaxID=682080 RepID=A0A9P4QUQ7_9PLEO|nr:cysteine proteinase [Polyplosphaeria fusca]
MADLRAQAQACKDAAKDSRSKLDRATSKEDAFAAALAAADSLIKAMKLTSDPDEKGQLKAECNDLLGVASRIKDSTTWPPAAPSLPPAQASPKNVEIGQWAANVAQSVQETASKDTTTSQSSHITAHSSVPLLDLSTESDAQSNKGNGPTHSGVPLVDPSSETDSQSSTGIGPAHSGVLLVDPSPEPRSQPGKGNSPFQPHSFTGQAAIVPTTASSVAQLLSLGTSRDRPSDSQSPVRRLKEPISTRKRSKREEIIVLKASVVNGFKFPPWDKMPSASEFALEEGAESFVDKRDLALSKYQQQFFSGWISAVQAIPPPSMFPKNRNGLGPLMKSNASIDLVQDAATDCSVVASLCAGIARAERGHDQILSNMIEPWDKNLGRPLLSPNGKYIVRLNFNGCWRKVEIDDRLPVSKTHRLLHVIDRRNPALLWPALLEKAYLKVRGGYDFPGSNSCGDLWALTGWIPEQVYLQETDIVPGQLWSRVYKAFLYGDVLVTVGTGKMSSKQERELGLEGQHSYVVLDMKETDHDRLLLVKNPWVEGKGWRGPRPSSAPLVESTSSSSDSRSSTNLYNRDSLPSIARPHPTTFWIALEHVIQHFESLYLNWNPGLFRHRQDIHFEWTIPSESPIGCIVDNPQFSFSGKDADAVWLLLTRHFRNAPEEARDESDAFQDGSVRGDSQVMSSGESLKGYMSIFVCNGKGERLYTKDTYVESGPYVNTTQSLLRWDCDAGSPFTVVIDQEELPASTYTFTLSAFSNTAISLEPAVQKLPLETCVIGEWTKQTAGGSPSSGRYFENPQYSLELRQTCDLAILLTSSHDSNQIHVKLAIGHGKRMYRLQSRDVLADSGDHRRGSVLARIKDLQPGLYTIICSQFEAEKIGKYKLRVDSTENVVLKPIPRDGAGLLSQKLAPACFGAKVHKIAAPLVPHRLARYTIVARFKKANSPRSADLGMVGRSPFRLSVERGRGPQRHFVIASERGDYSDSAVVRTESASIDPSENALNDLYLVLDRLSGPGGPIEEWYDVEIFTDMPKAFEIGVWREWDYDT